MNQLTFFDKIQVLFKLLFSSPIIIGIFAFSLILMIILFFSSRLNKKIIKYIFIGIYLLVIGFSIVKYGSYFLTSLDSFLTLFMANIYFPVIPIYVAIMVISFIIMIVTLSGRHKSRFIKILNIIFFTLIQMLFVVFIYVIETNNIDLSTNTGLYSNEQTMTLLELGMGLFVLWIILLLVIFYLKKADKIFKVKKKEEQDDFDEYINDYNEPRVNNVSDLSNVNNSFNSNIVQSLVPETSNYEDVEEIISFDEPSLNSNSLGDSFASNEVVSPVVEENNLEVINPINSVSIENSNNYVNPVNNIDTANKVEEHSNNFINPVDEVITKNNFIDNNINNKVNPSVDDIFSNFQFLDIPNKVERKNDDVEVIDFD